MQIDTAIIWAPLIVAGQISARLADAAVAFVSSLRLWKQQGFLTIHDPLITTLNPSPLWTLSAGVNWSKPEPRLPLCLPPTGRMRQHIYVALHFFHTFQHTEMLKMNTSQVSGWQGGFLLGIHEAMLRNVLYVPAECWRTDWRWGEGGGGSLHHSVRSKSHKNKLMQENQCDGTTWQQHLKWVIHTDTTSNY